MQNDARANDKIDSHVEKTNKEKNSNYAAIAARSIRPPLPRSRLHATQTHLVTEYVYASHQAACPPSTRKSVAVTKLLASLSRNTAAPL